ncbi:MAG TPA: peptidylprolyl isomerase [Chromatiales bacterium]|nr:peptidylprolyl isomerase [Chromatiales bacterium]
MKKIILIVIVALLTACSGDQSEVLATVNGRDVTADEFKAYVAFKHIQIRDDKHKKALLKQYLERDALSDSIESQYDKTTKIKIKAELDDFRRQINISRYFETYLKNTVTDQKIQNYYATHEDQYSDTKVHVAHILIRLKKNLSETERKAKLTIATEAWSKLKANGDMKKIADNYSEDRISAKKGGDLGWLRKGSIDPKFSKKIFEMKKGEISEPFETSFGYHIVKVIEEPKVVKKPFEAVKGDIRYLLRQQVKQAKLDSLRAKSEINLHE